MCASNRIEYGSQGRRRTRTHVAEIAVLQDEGESAGEANGSKKLVPRSLGSTCKCTPFRSRGTPNPASAPIFVVLAQNDLIHTNQFFLHPNHKFIIRVLGMDGRSLLTFAYRLITRLTRGRYSTMVRARTLIKAAMTNVALVEVQKRCRPVLTRVIYSSPKFSQCYSQRVGLMW